MTPADTSAAAAPGTARGGTRAEPMAPDDRRAAIAQAAIPLLVAHGAGVTTRQIADAAGIAEGTIFRAFPDKASVVRAAIDAAMDPTPTSEAIAAIDEDLDLEQRMEAAVHILQERTTVVFQLMSLLANMPEATADRPAAVNRAPRDLDSLVAIFERDAHRLRRTPRQAAQLLRAVTLGGTHPIFAVDGPLAPDEIVSLVLDGVRAPDEGAARC